MLVRAALSMTIWRAWGPMSELRPQGSGAQVVHRSLTAAALNAATRRLEQFPHRPAHFARLVDRLDRAGPLMDHEVDRLGDAGRIVFAAEQHVAAYQGAADVRSSAQAADEILDGA